MLKVQQVLAIVLLLAGVVLMFTVVRGAGQPPAVLADIARFAPHMMGIGVVWYIAVRMLILFRDRQ